jgi:hypothetical protein
LERENRVEVCNLSFAIGKIVFKRWLGDPAAFIGLPNPL